MSLYFATTARGIEPILCNELHRLGALHVKPSHGGVYFEGDKALLYSANLWLRVATRILVPLKEFSALTPAMLYDQVRRIKWENFLDPEFTFAIDCTMPTATKYFSHSHYVALKIKDAIVDQLRLKQGLRPNVDAENPDLRIHAFLNGNRCTLSFDASGRSLHGRGYRKKGGTAPLKETLAAAIIEFTEWDGTVPLIDPMCGSGTLLIEAAMKALDIAPGILFPKFGFMRWKDFDQNLWNELFQKAQEKIKTKAVAPLIGFDADPKIIAQAQTNAATAHVSHAIHFECQKLESLQPVGDTSGVIITNPPYGVRWGEKENLSALYKLLGDIFKQKMKGWQAYVFAGNFELVKKLGLRTSKRIALYNGSIECRLLKYDLY